MRKATALLLLLPFLLLVIVETSQDETLEETTTTATETAENENVTTESTGTGNHKIIHKFIYNFTNVSECTDFIRRVIESVTNNTSAGNQCESELSAMENANWRWWRIGVAFIVITSVTFCCCSVCIFVDCYLGSKDVCRIAGRLFT